MYDDPDVPAVWDVLDADVLPLVEGLVLDELLDMPLEPIRAFINMNSPVVLEVDPVRAPVVPVLVAEPLPDVPVEPLVCPPDCRQPVTVIVPC
jgi:hypothetical protein